jgi:dihydroorotate dehydrogenase (NAD+) catalytic subunit
MEETNAPSIQLAPQHDPGLTINNPVMVSAGCYGLGSEYLGLVDLEGLGAIVVGPVTMRARHGATHPRSVPFAGGVLLHTGLANPGVPATLKRKSRTWTKSPVPVVLHIAATTPQETSAACERVEAVESIAAIELGLGFYTSPEEALSLVSAAAESYGNGPLLVRLPLETSTQLAQPATAGGAHALTIGAPPRGTVRYGTQWITGRLYGPFVLPLALRTLRAVTNLVQVPLIGCGGVYDHSGARMLLRAGASTVQIDSALWKDPTIPARIAKAIVHTDS